MYLTFSILGLIGGLLCAIGDVLFDLKGKGNKKLGTSKNIDSNWIHMADWRFGASIMCAMVGDVFAGLGIFSLGLQIAGNNQVLGYITIGCGYVGIIAGFFVHSLLCTQALIYKGIMKKGNLSIADDALETVYKQVMLPFIVGYIILMIPGITTIIAIAIQALDVPMWCIILNPVIFLPVGTIFRKINPVLFQDLPGIVMPSLGLAMLGLIGIMNLL